MRLRSCLLALGWQWGGRWFLWEWGIWGPRACLPAEPSEAKYFVGGIVLGVGEGCSEWGDPGWLLVGTLKEEEEEGWESTGSVGFLHGEMLVPPWRHRCPRAWDWLSAMPCHRMPMAGQSQGNAQPRRAACAAPGPARSPARWGAKPRRCCTRCWLHPRVMELPLLPR